MLNPETLSPGAVVRVPAGHRYLLWHPRYFDSETSEQFMTYVDKGLQLQGGTGSPPVQVECLDFMTSTGQFIQLHPTLVIDLDLVCG